MSDVYVRRLDAVRKEFDVAASALRYTIANWQREEIIAHFLSHRLQQVRDTETNLEATYFCA